VQPYPFNPGPGAVTVTAQQELAGLKEQAQYFQNALDDISKRIEELETARQED
jgi:prefoldin subunit 5